MTAAQMRRLALSMPEAVESSHFGNPDFRVNKKIFAGMSADGTRATLKLTPEIQSVVLNTEPAVFSPCAGAWGRSGWTFVELASAAPAQIEHLVHEAWSLTAPKRLVAAAEGAKPKPRKASASPTRPAAKAKKPKTTKAKATKTMKTTKVTK